eukprot:scaffold5155_cov132-Skeletonema_marinoi.AAC.5
MRHVQLNHRIAANAVLTSLDTVKTSYKMHPKMMVPRQDASCSSSPAQHTYFHQYCMDIGPAGHGWHFY